MAGILKATKGIIGACDESHTGKGARQYKLVLEHDIGEDWLDKNEPLTLDEKALLDARLAAYTEDPAAGSSWEEVEGRVRDRLNRQAKRVN